MGSHDGDLAFFFFQFVFCFFARVYHFYWSIVIFFSLCSCASRWHLLVIKGHFWIVGSYQDLGESATSGDRDRDREIVHYCYGLQGFTSMVVVQMRWEIFLA